MATSPLCNLLQLVKGNFYVNLWAKLPVCEPFGIICKILAKLRRKLSFCGTNDGNSLVEFLDGVIGNGHSKK